MIRREGKQWWSSLCFAGCRSRVERVFFCSLYRRARQAKHKAGNICHVMSCPFLSCLAFGYVSFGCGHSRKETFRFPVFFSCVLFLSCLLRICLAPLGLYWKLCSLKRHVYIHTLFFVLHSVLLFYLCVLYVLPIYASMPFLSFLFLRDLKFIHPLCPYVRLVHYMHAHSSLLL